jgi:hemerythrin
MLNWTPEYESGSGLVDEQHKELFRRVNALLAACEFGMGKEEIEKTISFIEDYVDYHFASEEALMLKYEYPDYEEHKLYHDLLRSRYFKMKEEITSGRLSVPDILRLHAFLADWVRMHTMSVDKVLGAFLKSRGIEEELLLKEDVRSA